MIGLGLDGSEVGVRNFPLPGLEGQLRKFAIKLHEGRGFFVLRGLDPKMYSREDNILIFLGISSYIGAKRGRQDDEGRMLCECRTRDHPLMSAQSNVSAHVRLARLMQCQLDQRPIKDSNLGCVSAAPQKIPSTYDGH